MIDKIVLKKVAIGSGEEESLQSGLEDAVGIVGGVVGTAREMESRGPPFSLSLSRQRCSKRSRDLSGPGKTTSRGS